MAVIGIGRHAVRVVSHILGRSSTGTPHIAVLFEDVNGDRITWYGYLSDAAMERTITSLRVLGWDPLKDDGRIDRLNGTETLVGAEAEVVVEAETYNGESRMKVKWVNEPGGGGLGDGMASEDANAFATSIRAKILAAPKPKANSQPGPAKVPAAVAPEDDGLPF
jgi:hypothetical protein